MLAALTIAVIITVFSCYAGNDWSWNDRVEAITVSKRPAPKPPVGNCGECGGGRASQCLPGAENGEAYVCAKPISKGRCRCYPQPSNPIAESRKGRQLEGGINFYRETFLGTSVIYSPLLPNDQLRDAFKESTALTGAMADAVADVGLECWKKDKLVDGKWPGIQRC